MEQMTATEPAVEASAAPRPETIRLQPTRGFSRVLAPRELWRYRDLALQIVLRDITVRYRQTAFGAAWAIMQPLAFMVVFSLFFGRVAGVSSDGLPYPLFSLAALVPWTFFANTLLLSAESLVVNQQLVSKIYFPRIFVPAGVIAAGFVDIAISIVILLDHRLRLGLRPLAGDPRPAAADRHGRRDGARRRRGALGDQRPLPRRPLRRPLRDPDVALHHSRRLLEQRPLRALAAALGDQPDGRRRRRLPLGGARHRQCPAGPDGHLGRRAPRLCWSPALPTSTASSAPSPT